MGGVPVSTNSSAPQAASDTTIASATTDNTAHDYWFRATFQGGSADVGVLGAIVGYTTIGAPEP
jgi:hypothetical protein